MTLTKPVLIFLLGVLISIGAQYLGGLLYSFLPVSVIKYDPALSILYTTAGLVITIICASYAMWQKKYIFVYGLFLGLILWYPFLMIGMSISNSWL